MILFALEAFAAKRRKAQDDAIAALAPIVKAALAELGAGDADWAEKVLAYAARLYNATYKDESSEKINVRAKAAFLKTLAAALDKSEPDSEVAAVSLMVANAAINSATMAAADADPEDLVLEWVDMEDSKVRKAHRLASGQQRPPGEPFLVDGVKMSGPGDVTAPIELWINCRCVLRPALAGDFALTAAGGYDGVTHAGLAIVAQDTSAVLLAQRSPDDTDDPEVAETWEFPGGGLDADEDPQAGAFREFSEEVGYRGFASEVVDGWRSTDGVYQGFVVHTPTQWDLGEWEPNKEVQAIGWFTREMIAENADSLRPEMREQTDWDMIFGSPGSEDDMTDAPTEDAQPIDVPTDEPAPTDEEVSSVTEPLPNPLVPWWGALTVEGKPSGDGRFFEPGSLTHRPMDDRHLPLSFQKVSAPGHENSETIGMIEGMGRDLATGLIYGWGHLRQTELSDEVVGLIADFGRFGVSIDADDAEMEFDEEAEMANFSRGRICGADVVGIPALHEAFVQLGEIPIEIVESLTPLVDAEEFPADEGVDPLVPEEAEEGLLASGLMLLAEKVKQFKDLAPGKTEDGPGWLTHPEDTDRLRDYWVRGEGAAKIGWGTPGDFNRCRLNLAEYVKPQYLNGYCANRHYDALHVWPGQEAKGSAETLTDTAPAPSVNLVASAGFAAPSPWFKNPEFKMGDPRLVEQPDGAFACPLTITDEGQVFGHIARWGMCHLSFGPEHCVTAPQIPGNTYAMFRMGAQELDDGTVEAVGNLTVGAGHAGLRLKARAAAAHYDNSAHRAATVTCGDDDFGIWVAGWVPPGTPVEHVQQLRSGTVSGDWRNIAGQKMLVAALAVNTGGFGITRVPPRLSISGGVQNSLVAAGMVVNTNLSKTRTPPSLDGLTASAIDQIAAKVVEQMAKVEAEKKVEREQNLQRIEALRARVKEHH